MARSYEESASRAYQEEQLAALYLIAAGVFFNAGWPVAGWLLVAKGLLDTASAIAHWNRASKLRKADQ